jgi:hypothetical protein
MTYAAGRLVLQDVSRSIFAKYRRNVLPLRFAVARGMQKQIVVKVAEFRTSSTEIRDQKVKNNAGNIFGPMYK